MSAPGTTPGPWFHRSLDADGERIADLIVGQDGETIIDDVLLEEDARLVAAAPELYEACALLDAYLHATAPDSNEAQIVRAALAKATPLANAGVVS